MKVANDGYIWVTDIDKKRSKSGYELGRMDERKLKQNAADGRKEGMAGKKMPKRKKNVRERKKGCNSGRNERREKKGDETR